MFSLRNYFTFRLHIVTNLNYNAAIYRFKIVSCIVLLGVIDGAILTSHVLR